MNRKSMSTLKRFRRPAAAKWLLGAVLALMLVSTIHVLARGQAQQQHPPDQASQQENNIPRTAQEHKQLAEQYQKKAAEYRQDAESHRKMLADYGKTVANNPKEVGENPYVKKMRLHCGKYIKEAEKLAAEADELARWHLLRAKELEGK